MKQETTLQKQNNGKPTTDSRLAIWLRDRLYPLLIFLTGTKVRCKVEVVNTCPPIPGKPIIFAANHSAFQDTPIMLRVTGRRSYIFSGQQNLAFIDWVFFVLNGTIWVDRKSKEDMAASKDAVLEYLAKGQSILWFPEGTWNLTPSQLMMPMKWGIIDMARQAEAQIVPAALDYDWEKNTCRIKFGTPMVGEALENKAEAIRDLRDTMATLRWDLMCDQPIVHRGQASAKCRKKCIESSTNTHPWTGNTKAPASIIHTSNPRKYFPIWTSWCRVKQMRFCSADNRIDTQNYRSYNHGSFVCLFSFMGTFRKETP